MKAKNKLGDILEAITDTEGNISAASYILGVSPQSIYQRLANNNLRLTRGDVPVFAFVNVKGALKW